MRYAVLLVILSLLLVAAGLQAGAWGYLVHWLALNFGILGIAHARGGHRIFGKRADGTIPVWSGLLFLPLLAYTGLIWHLIRLLSREPKLDQVSERLSVGRRLLASEAPSGFANYVDLTAEFQEPCAIRQTASYLSFPILDAAAPEPASLHAAVARLKPGSTFIHCAQGHGRTGLFALAVLLASKEVRSVDEGLAMLKAARPGIGLNPAQLKCLMDFAGMLEAG